MINFSFCPKNKRNPQDKFTNHLNKIKQDVYTKCKKLIFNWNDKIKSLIHHRLSKFIARHGMVVENVHEITTFKQTNCLDKNINFITQKRSLPKSDFEKDF